MEMMPTLRVDDEVYSKLQEKAVAFVDSPNTVLRRILGLDESVTSTVTKQPRARPDELLGHEAYRPAVLEALAERGGSAPARQIVVAVGEKLHDDFKPRD